MTHKTSNKKRFQRNINILSAVSFFIYFLPYVAVAVIIFEKLTGSYLEAMSVFTLMSLTIAFLEVPSGVLSDKIGRKWTLSLGCSLSLLNVIFLSLALHSEYALWLLYGAALSQGAAESLYSGNNDALVHDTLTSMRQSKAYPKLFGRMSSLRTAGLGISSIIGTLFLFYGLSFDSLIYASLITCSCLVILSLFIVEPTSKAKSHADSLKHIKNAFNSLKKRPRLALYSLVNVIQGGGAYSSYYFMPSFIASVWPLWAVPFFRVTQHLVEAFSFWNVGKVVKRFKTSKIMMNAVYFINGLGLVSFGISNVISPFLLICAEPFYAAWLTAKSSLEQESFSETERATMGSLINLGSSIVSAILSLIIGWLADSISLGMTLFIVVGVRAVIVTFGYRSVYKYHK